MHLQATLKNKRKPLQHIVISIILYLLVSYKHLTTLKHTNYIQRRRRFKSKKEKKEQEQANPNTRRKKKIQIQEKRS
jgi:hypothetical protein